MTQKETSDSTKKMVEHLYLLLAIVCPGSDVVTLPWMGVGMFKAKIANVVLTQQITVAFKQIYMDAILTSESDGFVFACDIEKMKQYIIVNPEDELSRYINSQSNMPHVQMKKVIQPNKSVFKRYISTFLLVIALMIIFVGDKVEISSIADWHMKKK